MMQGMLRKLEKEEDVGLPNIPASGDLDVTTKFHHLKVDADKQKTFPLKNLDTDNFNSRRNYVTIISGLLFGFLLTRSD